MITAIAIDDEPLALEVVKNLAKKVPFLQLAATFTNAFEALEYLNKQSVDLLFLDIRMPDISGIDFFNSLNNKPFVVFTTAYSEHAITGFELNAADYLLKPFSLSRFLKACNKVQAMLDLKQGGNNRLDYIFVKAGYDQVKVCFEEIDYLEATGNYVTFVLGDVQVVSRMTISECEALLPKPAFVRIHRSFIVSVEKIQRIERHQVTVNRHILPVGSSYAASLVEIVQKQR